MKVQYEFLPHRSLTCPNGHKSYAREVGIVAGGDAAWICQVCGVHFIIKGVQSSSLPARFPPEEVNHERKRRGL
jgi:hypothetical protein